MSRNYEEESGYMRRRSRGSAERQRAGGENSGRKVMDSAQTHSRRNTRRMESRQPSSAGRMTAAAAAGNGVSGSGLSLHQERKLRKRRRRRRMIAMIIAECFALALIFGYGYFLRHWNQIQRPEFNELEVKNNDLNVETVEKMKGYWTIAVFGVDSRDKALTKSTNADVNMICNINMDTGEIKLVSVYRDSYLNISKDGSYNKINQAYFMGGPEQAVAALNRNLDLDIKNYMTFNWKAVADAINVLGGVDLEISKAEFYYINSFITETVKVTGVGSYPLKSAGMNHLDGVQAVAYGRLRLMDTDYARTERQRKVITLAFEKAKKADFQTLNAVLGSVFPQVATNINVNDIFNALKIISRYHIGETTGFPQARGDANMGKKGACVIPQTLETNVVKLHEFLFGEQGYVPSETVKSISAKIAADSGMYKEGRYIDRVGTEGGVIQSAKESKSAAASSAADEKRYADIYVLDENGKKVKKTVTMKKNADGKYIEPETDADGLAVNWSINSEGKLVERGTDADGNETIKTSESEKESRETETDENGEPIETSVQDSREDENESGGVRRPAESETDERGRPLPTESDGRTQLPPGFLDESESGSEGPPSGTLPTMSPSPGQNHTAPTSANGNASRPTTAFEPQPTVVSAPGSTEPMTSVSNGPGGTTAAQGQPQNPSPAPGAASVPAAPSSGVSNGPGSVSQTAGQGESPSNGVVAGPGQ